MKWETLRIADLGQVVTGSTPPTTERRYYGSHCPLIKPTDMAVDGFRIGPTEESLSLDGYELFRNRVVPAETTCVVTIGTIGKVCLTREPSVCNQAVNCVVADRHRYDPYFVFYLMKMTVPKVKFLSSGTASGRENVSKSAFEGIEVRIPQLPLQKRIGSILRNYDELIENSQRRIYVLEKMVYAFYREWFVRYQFPGHENIDLISLPLGDIPHGWEVKTVEEIVKRIPVGKKYAQKTVFPTGAVPVFDQGKSGVIGYHNDKPGVEATEESPVIVFANHTCYQRLVHTPFSAIQNVLPFVPHPSMARNIYWLHWATNGLVVLNDYKGHWPEFVAKQLVVPPADLCKQFGDFAAPVSRQVMKLERTIDNLRRTRDLLLPRLLSGQIVLEAA